MSRDNRLDSIKGFLIILVILGHLIGVCGTGTINGSVRTFIYTFHMPLFIFISGYLTKIKDDKKKFWKEILNLGIPLIIFQVAFAIFLFAFHIPIEMNMLWIPYWTLWYLLSLIFWRLMLQFSPKSLLNKPIIYLAIAFAVSIICGLIPNGIGRILSIQRTLNFFPFFLYGYYLRQGKVPSKIWNNYISYGFLFIIVVLIALRLYPQNCELLLKGADHYGFSHIPSKICIFIASFVTSISFFNIINERKVLSVIGKDSLLYYLYHGFIIKFAILPIALHFSLPQTFPFMLLYCVIIVTAIYVMSRIYVFRWICNPFAKKSAHKS